MKLSEMRTNDEAIVQKLRDDPEFRAEWERTALGRAVALAVVRYRGEGDISQRELARRLGMRQPQVARLERGDVNPTIDTLARLVTVLDIELTIDMRPPKREPKLVTKRAQTNRLLASFETQGAAVAVSAA
jgi:ribosome-binding protein aMBF1 (putative translation factor)